MQNDKYDNEPTLLFKERKKLLYKYYEVRLIANEGFTKTEIFNNFEVVKST